jgi:hypothetical protein
MPILAYESLDGVTFDRREVIERRSKGIATLLSRDGKEVKVEIGTSPILDKDTGAVSGVAAILRKVEGAS